MRHVCWMKYPARRPGSVARRQAGCLCKAHYRKQPCPCSDLPGFL